MAVGGDTSSLPNFIQRLHKVWDAVIYAISGKEKIPTFSSPIEQIINTQDLESYVGKRRKHHHSAFLIYLPADWQGKYVELAIPVFARVKVTQHIREGEIIGVAAFPSVPNHTYFVRVNEKEYSLEGKDSFITIDAGSKK
jgi:hypothetical protein